MASHVSRGLAAAALAMGLLATTAAGSAAAASPAPTGDAPRVVTGGVSEEERDALLQQAGSYNLWLVFAEQGTGNYLANVQVALSDARGEPLLDVVTDGPWLFAQLPPGRYTVRTGMGHDQAVTVGNGRTMAIVRLAGTH